MKFYRVGVLILLSLLPIAGHAEENFPGAAWEPVAAGAAGWSSRKLAEAEA